MTRQLRGLVEATCSSLAQFFESFEPIPDDEISKAIMGKNEVCPEHDAGRSENFLSPKQCLVSQDNPCDETPTDIIGITEICTKRHACSTEHFSSRLSSVQSCEIFL